MQIRRAYAVGLSLAQSGLYRRNEILIRGPTRLVEALVIHKRSPNCERCMGV